MQALDLYQFAGTVVIVAPHMDDEALACGGLIAKLPDKNRIHLIYATDGMKSPAPIMVGDEITPDLGRVRIQESVEAMKMLGVPEQNLLFLSLPEAELKDNLPALEKSLGEKLKELDPQFIFSPFRYDRHLDHLAVNHTVVAALEKGSIKAQLVEYFVYYRWRLLPKRDIRKYIRPQFLFQLDIADVAALKRQSLNCFVSQTTIYYPWQTRPILTPLLLDEECANPEYFMMNASYSGTSVFSHLVPWIRLAHRLEPILLRWKYLTLSTLKRVFQNRVR
ncbi:MAG TPA: PIG-L deacetylase family protein [Anaerolineales bacterium]|nr:PIG-L deacetylase family protein [Anaerolineales bacterium]